MGSFMCECSNLALQGSNFGGGMIADVRFAEYRAKANKSR
jgi:hypothetical protein